MWVRLENIFVLARSDITHSHRYKIAHKKFSMDCRQNTFALRDASICNSYSDDDVALERGPFVVP